MSHTYSTKTENW